MAVLSDDMGGITAYAAAVNRGYTGTKEEFEQLMYSYTEVAERAEAAAGNAHESEEGSIEAKDIAVSAKNEAVSARDAAQSARDASISAKNNSESARDAAVNAKNDTLAAKDAVMSAKGSVDETSANFSDEVTAAISDVNAAGRNQKELAKTHAVDSEAWAVGQREGADVGVSDETYHNNSKYYAEQSALAKSETESARDTAITAKNDAVSAKNEAETAKGQAQDIVDGINAKSEQIDQNAEDISDLQTAISTKAEIDGNYENLTAGTAEQLASTVFIEDNAPYHFRTSGGSADIGDREYDQIVGGTVNWNQLVQNGNFENADNWSATNATGFSVSDGVASFTPTALYGNIHQFLSGKPLKANHVILCIGDMKADGALENCQLTISDNINFTRAKTVTLSTAWQTVFLMIKETTVAYSNNHTVAFRTVLTSDFAKMYVKNAMLFDLTQMFSTTIADYVYSLETATAGSGVAWLKAHFPKIFDSGYIPYNAGTLEHMSGLSAHKMTGFNQWDEEWEVGSIDITTGQNTINSTTLRAKNYTQIVPSTQYYFLLPWAYVFWYDVNKNYISYSGNGVTEDGNVHGKLLISPENAYYCRFRCSGTYGTTYKNDICINLHWDGELDGKYEPYEEHSYPLDSDVTLRGIYKLDANGQLYTDGDEYVSDGTVTRRYVVVDLGVLSWSRNISDATSIYYFVAHASGIKLNTQLICSKYMQTRHAPNDSNMPDKSIYNRQFFAFADNVIVRDDAYADETSFKAAMSGVMLVYELATPITEQAQPFTNPQIVDDFGTEEYVTTSIVPVGHVTKYANNLRAKLEMAPNSPDGDGDYIVRQTNGLNEYVSLSSSEVIQNINEAISDNAEQIETKADITDMLKAFPTDTVTGAVASFSDGANLPLKSLVVNIDPVQDLHGQDAPYPAGGGKNLLEVTATSQTINGVTFTVNDDETVTANGTATASAFFELITSNISFTESTILNGCPSGGGGTTYAIQLNAATLEVGSGITIAANTTITSVRIRIASGVTLNNVVFKPMIRLATETDDTFAPYENICPISGWSDVNVGVSGKNLFDSNFSDYTKPYNYYICPIKLENGKRYKLKAELVGTTITGATFGLAKSGNRYEEFVGTFFVIGSNGDAREFSITVDDTFTDPKLIAYVSGENQFNELFSNYNIMLMPYEQADYEPYSGTSVTIDLGQTVYGGTLDVLSGVLTIDRAMVDMGTLNWASNGTDSVYTHMLTNKLIGGDNCVCSALAKVAQGTQVGSMSDVTFKTYANSTEVAVKLSGITNQNAQTMLSGFQFVYPLAAPLTIQLAPHEVRSLLGSNNVWSDAGEVTAEYRADPTLYIGRLTEPDADMVADANITSGQYFMVGNTLYKATANIASGATISPNANCTRKSLSEALNELNA